MLPSLTGSVLWRLPARTLNILLSPGGDGNLLKHADKILLPPMAHRDFTFSSLTLILIHTCLSILVRYVLGHAVATLLILENYNTKGAAIDPRRQNSKRCPVFRSVSDAIRLIYREQGVCYFARGFGTAVIYTLAHYAVRSLLAETVFGHTLLRPFAYAVTSVLLCELHLSWTRTTISVRQQSLTSFDIKEDKEKRRILAFPAFTHGMVLALMYEVQRFMEQTDTSAGQLQPGIGARASTEVLSVVLMFGLRVLALLPATVALTLAEASLLPETLETVIPSPTKQRGATIVELVDGARTSSVSSMFTGALRSRGRPQLLWLIELHLKKCFIQIGLELLFLLLLGAVL